VGEETLSGQVHLSKLIQPVIYEHLNKKSRGRGCEKQVVRKDLTTGGGMRDEEKLET
jgi:hypothetical protein